MLEEVDPGYHASGLDVYYTNRDLRLLFDFFSISSGVAPAIGILASVDKVRFIGHLYHSYQATPQSFWLSLRPSIMDTSLAGGMVKLSYKVLYITSSF